VPRELTVGKEQDGATLALRVGESLLLQLPENPTSGYRWAFARLDDTRLTVDDAAYRSDDPRPGTGGVATWTLRARAPGQPQVELKRWRPWEGDRSIVERFSITLDIKPA
jgi:inhibitor of cysteine peptidase